MLRTSGESIYKAESAVYVERKLNAVYAARSAAAFEVPFTANFGYFD